MIRSKKSSPNFAFLSSTHTRMPGILIFLPYDLHYLFAINLINLMWILSHGRKQGKARQPIPQNEGVMMNKFKLYQHLRIAITKPVKITLRLTWLQFTPSITIINCVNYNKLQPRRFKRTEPCRLVYDGN